MTSPRTPRVGDVKSRVGNQTRFYTSRDIARIGGTPAATSTTPAQTAPAPARATTAATLQQLSQVLAAGQAVRSLTQAVRERTQGTPALTPLTTPDGTIAAANLTSGGAPPVLPPPTAPAVQANFQQGLEATIASARANLDNTLKVERDAALKRQDELNARLEAMMRESDPTKRATYAQEQEILQNQLNAAQTASATLEEDFNRRRKIVGELDHLLTQGNQAIETARAMPVAMSVLNKSVAATAQMVHARAGVLQAVVSGLDGNINTAHSIINNASNAVAAVWQDQLVYNQAYMNLVENGQLAKNKIQTDYANAQIRLAENKLKSLTATKEHLIKLMIDPESAQFIADAGVTLNDSIEEINTKMANRAGQQEREDIKNELALEGYQYVPFAEGRTDVVTLEIGGEMLSFVPPVDTIRELEEEKLRAQISNLRGGEVFNTPRGQILQVPTFDEFIAQKEREEGMSFSPVVREQYRKQYEDEKLVMEQTVRVAALSPVAREIINNPQAYYDLTPSLRGEVFAELARNGIDTNVVLTGKKRALPATQVENLSQAKGVRFDVEKLYTMLHTLPGTGPISGRLQALNPYHPQRIAIDAQITRIVPGLARGIFQEVGVLTDQDVERYTATLANPNMTNAQIEQLHRDTLQKIDHSIKITVDTFSQAGFNMDGFQQGMVGQSPHPGVTPLSVDEAWAKHLENRKKRLNQK